MPLDGGVREDFVLSSVSWSEAAGLRPGVRRPGHSCLPCEDLFGRGRHVVHTHRGQRLSWVLAVYRKIRGESPRTGQSRTVV